MNTVVNTAELKNKTTIDPVARSHDGYTVEVITGSAVIELLVNDPLFQQSWDKLYDSCPWGTVFQGRSFIAAWYQVYRDQHLPMLVRAVERGQLKGALPMVLLNATANEDRPGSKITGAGHYDAQYQTWLAAPDDADAFIKKALAELIKQFPGHPVSFRFLPPGTPLDWIKDDTKWRRYSIMQSYVRPLINFNDPAYTKLFRGSHFRNKFNRLKRLGEVHFECITDYKKFESSLNEMAVMYDFRHSALFNKSHFRDDPLKKAFLLELFRCNLLHVTVLKVDGKTMAAIVAVTGKDGWVHLAGINCHSPYKARSYSPGILHFALLSKQLAEEHNQFFDLTTGYDAYKEELANGHDEVKEWLISPSLKFRLKKKIRKWVHARLIASRIRPMTVELKGKKFFYLLRRRSAMSVINALVKRFHKKSAQKLYPLQTYSLPQAIKISLHKDNLKDLLQFDSGKRSAVTKWEFLSDAMRRFDLGQHCFTWMENGRLLGCAWFGCPEPLAGKKESNPEGDNSIVMQGLYGHPAGKERSSSFLNEVIDVLVNKEGKNYFLTDDPLFARALELAGSRAMSE